MKRNIYLLAAILLTALPACRHNKTTTDNMESYKKGTFGYDLHFLSQKDSLVTLTSGDGEAQVIVSPRYQGKVFTSTSGGLGGKSLGYLNYTALEAEELNEHINAYGGENRLWLGPEGGRYSVFFEPGAAQVFDNWHTPKPLDIEPWTVLFSDRREVALEKEMQVSNYLGNRLQVKLSRKVRLLEASEIKERLGIAPAGGVKLVAYATENSVTNAGDFAWTEETGTVCIWILDMFNTAPRAVTVVPFDEKAAGVVATTDYFGEIPADRFKTVGSVAYLKTDGHFRSKIGMSAGRTTAIAGNYDPDSGQLTIITFDKDREGIYLNQEWNPEKDPLVGDALNAYNDGPLEDGSIMGPFLELESASPAAFLSPGESLAHSHHVFHFTGGEDALSEVTEALLGVSIQEIKQVF
ncbi:MAG: hypothetical protein LBQ78_07470 [Tannerellaceae bacterium]|jgi:hypothetical protein|nr:hypothetical protein [Tannerellaceae bacterium]